MFAFVDHEHAGRVGRWGFRAVIDALDSLYRRRFLAQKLLPAAELVRIGRIADHGRQMVFPHPLSFLEQPDGGPGPLQRRDFAGASVFVERRAEGTSDESLDRV